MKVWVSEVFTIKLGVPVVPFLQIVVRHSEHPPIMNGTSWTLAAPFKEQKHFRTPSESIANNYTPTAGELKIQDLVKMKRPRRGILSGINNAPCLCTVILLIAS